MDSERRAFASLEWDAEFGDRSQEVVVICLRASGESVLAALEDALVTDEEPALAGVLEFADPFAEWHEPDAHESVPHQSGPHESGPHEPDARESGPHEMEEL